MIDGEEQEILLNTLAETPQEEVHTIEEDIYVIGVESLNGQAGDLTLKSINGENLVGEGNIALQTPLNQAQLNAVNSGIDSTKVGQIATNATNITTLQNTKQDNLTQTQLNAVNSGIDATKVAQIATNTGNITSVTNRVTTIEGKIPSAASSSNKLTDKNYVDNAIATNTANYISDNGQTFQSYADLVAYSGPLTNNDYAFVETIDQAGNDIYTRYKYNADQNLWAEEYTITNPYFTSDQWASINSGIAANDVAQIGTNKSDIASLQSGKQDALTETQLAAVDSGIDATKVQQIATNAGNITSLQTDKQDKLIAGTNIQIAADGKTISATDTTYTAGTGLTLTGTQFSVTEPVPNGFFTDTAATQEGTGTTITLNNTVDAPIDNVELKGDTFQQTYSGKNLLPPPADFTENINGLEIKCTNGEWAFSGTPTSGQMTVQNVIAPYTIQPGDYFHYNNTLVSSRINIALTFTDNTIFANSMNSENRIISLVNYVGKTIASVKANFNNGYEYTGTAKPMILNNVSTVTSFEPYVGGVPSPNPDYPQDIQVVTGEQTVTVTGKNLLYNHTGAGTATSAGVQITTDSVGNITATGTATGIANTIPLTQQQSSIYQAGTYTMSVSEMPSTNGSIIVETYLPNDTSTRVNRFASGNGVSSLTFTITQNMLLRISLILARSGDVLTNFAVKNLQLELGSTATAYEPYQAQTYEVNLGKNLWGGFANDFTGTPAGISFNNKADGTIEVGAGTSTAEANSMNSGQARDNGRIITLPAGRYTLSGSTSSIRVLVVDSTGYGLATSINEVPVSFTLSEKTGVFIRASIPANTTVEATTVRPQLEAGSTATTYAPYFTPIELCKIGTYQDYIWKDGADWKIHKEVGKVVLDGSNDENWSIANTGTVNFYYRTDQNIAPGALLVSGGLISNYESYGEINNTNTISGVAIDGGYRVRLRYGTEMSVASWQSQLVSTNMALYYVLATPTDTAITDATLISQLDALASSTTYAQQTNYTTSTASPNLPAILTVDVFKNNYAGLLARLNKAGA